MENDFDPDFGSALDAAAAIRARKISSVELTKHTFRRIDAFQPRLNAYVYQLREEALAAARQADEAVARNTADGVFHGVPINIKESFGVIGQPCTWGISAFKNSKAPQHAVVVRRLIEAGAILLGATNVPADLADVQTFNDVYGTTNNPWDVARTPGGSSGGSAASLAGGMAFLSVGSDIGGSIRTPASFCGIYGHKPTVDLVSLGGHPPGGVHDIPGFSTLLSVAGPMARSAEDLEAGLRVLAGPESPSAKAYRWVLPKPRHQSLSGCRVGYVLEDPFVPVSVESKSVLEKAIRACENAGATLKQGWPDGFRFQEAVDTYFFLLGAFVFSVRPAEDQQQARAEMAKRPDYFAKGCLSDFAEWQKQNIKRLAYRALWEKFFGSVDVFLLPTTFTTAFPHDHTPAETRMIPMPEGGALTFWNMLAYISPATLTGCPATTAPAGLSKSGLPVGLQIIGPYLEDATPIGFAQLLAREIGGFQPPEGYRLSF
ncbi:MAG TPA: amidase family protein [Terriglobia bacterium]|nr:amidase family protein [Terriglobia bacterium]